jgi:hypothetical protein
MRNNETKSETPLGIALFGVISCFSLIVSALCWIAGKTLKSHSFGISERFIGITATVAMVSFVVLVLCLWLDPND